MLLHIKLHFLIQNKTWGKNHVTVYAISTVESRPINNIKISIIINLLCHATAHAVDWVIGRPSDVANDASFVTFAWETNTPGQLK